MEFSQAAPWLLREENGVYYADWKIASSNYGMSNAKAAAWVRDALEDARGWSRAGVVFRQRSDAKVTFEVVLEASCAAPADVGCTTHFGGPSGTALVEMEVSRYPKIKITNHEAAHAFFYATHTGDGVMNTPGQPDFEWPSENDLASVAAELGTTVSGSGEDSPLPLVPVGEPRSFDLVFPQLPPIEGPGTGSDPSGSGGSSACADELSDLVDAVNASPTQENSQALASFIEAQTGQSMESLIPAWGDVIDDGVQRTAEIEVCGVILSVTISGDLNESTTCANLPTYTVNFPQNNFDLQAVVTDTWAMARPQARSHLLERAGYLGPSGRPRVYLPHL